MERCLVDTNVFVRLLNKSDPHYQQARRAIDKAIDEGYRLCIAPQIVAELWNVATRPQSANGLGLSITQTAQEVFRLLDRFEALYGGDSVAAFTLWLALVAYYGVQGKQVHDARLVATMLAHNVQHLLTFNGQDFARYAHLITILDAGTP